MNRLFRAAEFSHLILGNLIKPGQIVVDATAGNGNDTLFLAKQAGRSGKVYAFDIQKEAIENTEKLLKEHNCHENVKIIEDNHENLGKYISDPVNCIIYNLGYLPGGDKNIATSAESTVRSIKWSISALAPEGVLAVVVYPGHAGGDREASEVEDFLTRLPAPPWYVLSWKRINASGKAPYLLLAQKQAINKRGCHDEKTAPEKNY